MELETSARRSTLEAEALEELSSPARSGPRWPPKFWHSVWGPLQVSWEGEPQEGSQESAEGMVTAFRQCTTKD